MFQLQIKTELLLKAERSLLFQQPRPTDGPVRVPEHGHLTLGQGSPQKMNPLVSTCLLTVLLKGPQGHTKASTSLRNILGHMVPSRTTWGHFPQGRLWRSKVAPPGKNGWYCLPGSGKLW